ncbi:hypothetical protein D6851_05370 [Altericroceibacterium spongiae]|uniref:Pentapeptide MXKDX repeat protein n=1 Tax=Altericroceibacterium spongiae TaxID=2320269 RepID=A0A420EPN2_9SPHN|nr:hypothetical protein [Altericroceibacterium spongiae]RKF22645.1 hypothetical protein D6851_05370 [Altericroceibacterium spongiae]
MKKLIFGLAAFALATPATLLAQQKSGTQSGHQDHGQTKTDESGEMSCPMMDHGTMNSGQMDHGQMNPGQMGGQGMAHGSADGHADMAHCGMMDGTRDHSATGHDGHAQHRGTADHSQHQGHTPQ